MMRVRVVGATDVVGRSLVPLLFDGGHQVLALARASPLSEVGAEVERFDLLAVDEAGRLSEPLSGCSAVVHAATAVPRDFAAPGAWDANTRLRTEGTRLMLEAALSAGVAQAARKPEVPGFALAGDPRPSQREDEVTFMPPTAPR